VYDPVTLDQLRAFVTVVEEGSFSAAARKLERVQSAISTAMSNLESQLGVPIFDRSTKIATLTGQGEAVLASARRVLAEVDGLRRLTSGMVMGLEASVSLCLDALFPLEVLIEVCAEFTKAFPVVDLRIDTQVLSAVSARVLDGSATLGVVSRAGVVRGLERQVLASIQMLPVVSPRHPLAAIRGMVPRAAIADAIQIVLSERGAGAGAGGGGVGDQGVHSPRTWRVGDLHTKHMMLRAGLGWGNMPEHVVREDLRARRLVAIEHAAWSAEDHRLSLSAIYRSDTMFGPAHRWLIGNLARLCTRDAGEGTGESKAKGKVRPRRER
jgi:DNA-binding transcriptional LysR family regulator